MAATSREFSTSFATASRSGSRRLTKKWVAGYRSLSAFCLIHTLVDNDPSCYARARVSTRLAILTLAYIPDPPPIVCLEEPDRGIHPRLLRDVRDAIYRLSYPENYGEKRDAVQVIATTHSPYLLDLFRDHPEEVVIANKVGQDVRFERLSDRDELDEILGDAQLGDAWYSGVLGGVPSHP